MNAGRKERLIQAQRPQWRGYIQWLLSLLVLGGAQALTVLSLIRGPWWVAAVLVVLLGHLMHGQHGAHHRFGGIPHTRLPRESWLLVPVEPNEQPPFRSYLGAFRHMRCSLSDPRIGAQWLQTSAS